MCSVEPILNITVAEYGQANDTIANRVFRVQKFDMLEPVKIFFLGVGAVAVIYGVLELLTKPRRKDRMIAS